jgi:hypothetical protein
MKGSLLLRSALVASVARASVVLTWPGGFDASALRKIEFRAAIGWLAEGKFTPVGESQSFQAIPLPR